jgi:hypothetical protein
MLGNLFFIFYIFDGVFYQIVKLFSHKNKMLSNVVVGWLEYSKDCLSKNEIVDKYSFYSALFHFKLVGLKKVFFVLKNVLTYREIGCEIELLN